MKKIHFLLLISLLLAACSDDDKEKQPAFVTNITISDAGKTFNPGDAVTVKADGLQSGDQIILDIYWPIADNPLFPEGYSRYTRAVTTEQTTNSITFLAHGWQTAKNHPANEYLPKILYWNECYIEQILRCTNHPDI